MDRKTSFQNWTTPIAFIALGLSPLVVLLAAGVLRGDIPPEMFPGLGMLVVVIPACGLILVAVRIMNRTRSKRPPGPP
jgi:peptidoglycan/LPS O-acetylase OafA/YrhL